MNSLIKKVMLDYPDIVFERGPIYSWSPKTKTVIFADNPNGDESAIWSLFHELGHAVLGHKTYKTDMELIKLEVAAWAKAQEIASNYEVSIDDDHIQDCIDTYRDWLHQRSTCPKCNNHSFQRSARFYECYNCGQVWNVTSSRFCRPYRIKIKQNKKSPPAKSQRTTFA